MLGCNLIVCGGEVATSLNHGVIDQRKNLFERQAVFLVANGAWDAGNKQGEELVGVCDRTSADQVEADVRRSIHTDVARGGQGAGAGDREGRGRDGGDSGCLINSRAAGVIQVNLLTNLEVVVCQSHRNRCRTRLGIGSSTSGSGINKDVVVLAVTQPDLVNVSTADRGVGQGGVNIKDFGGVTNSCRHQAGGKQLARGNSKKGRCRRRTIYHCGHFVRAGRGQLTDSLYLDGTCCLKVCACLYFKLSTFLCFFLQASQSLKYSSSACVYSSGVLSAFLTSFFFFVTATLVLFL